MTAVFDTLGYANRLKAAGVPDKQAETLAEVFAEIIEDRVTTKQDLKELESRLKQDLKELEYRLTIRLGGMAVAAVVVIAALVKIL